MNIFQEMQESNEHKKALEEINLRLKKIEHEKWLEEHGGSPEVSKPRRYDMKSKNILTSPGFWAAVIVAYFFIAPFLK